MGGMGTNPLKKQKQKQKPPIKINKKIYLLIKMKISPSQPFPLLLKTHSPISNHPNNLYICVQKLANWLWFLCVSVCVCVYGRFKRHKLDKILDTIFLSLIRTNQMKG